jgi:hypothetical protein
MGEIVPAKWRVFAEEVIGGGIGALLKLEDEVEQE